MMPERILFEVINAGLEWYKDKPERFERFLQEDQELSAEEAVKGKLYFGGGTNEDGDTVPAKPPTLIHGYARTGGPFPCWALTLGAEVIETDFLGKDAPFLDSDGEHFVDSETGRIVDPKARRMRYTYNIMVHADHPDICIYYYHLLKSIVMQSQDTLENRDVEELEFSGQDMAPDPRYLPSDMFTRLLQVIVRGDETWCVRTFPEPGPKTVTGIHVDADGSGVPDGATGGEKALVAPYTED
jgi:hypothetical protein